MKISRALLASLLVFGLVFTLVKAQVENEKEESNIPKKVLRKYRIRRPVIVDANGNAITQSSVPRLRRIRVIKPQQPETSTQIQPSRNTLEGSIYSYNFQNANSLLQQQPIFEDQPQVIEPVRVVPMYRKATPSSTRIALLAGVHLKDHGRSGTDEETKKPIGTTRNYSRINEDGSFTFGYEGEDGSFKEETRGTDCVVRGKYGYVDPDGVSREFAYVSGNPCDPNDPDKDEALDEYEEPALPQRTVISRPRRPVINQNVQQSLDQSAHEETQAVPPRNNQRLRPEFQQPTTFRPQLRLTHHRIAPKPSVQPAYQPVQLQGRSVQPVFRRQSTFPPFPTAGPLLDERGANKAFDFEDEISRFQDQTLFYQQRPVQQPLAQFRSQTTVPPPPSSYESFGKIPQRQYFGGANAASILQHNQPTVPTFQQPRPFLPQPPLPTNSIEEQQPVTDFGRFRTELMFDPSKGRYTQVRGQHQRSADEQFTLTQRLRGFVDPKPPHQFPVQMLQHPQFQYYNLPQHQAAPQHQQYQRPAFQNQYTYQPQFGSLTGLRADVQEAIHSPATGQIDAFLSNLNTQS